MITRICAITAFVCLLVGCAKPFKANWYLQNNGDQKIYIAVLNQSKENQTVTEMILNQYEERCGQYRGWSKKLAAPEALEPGGILVMNAEGFEDKADGNKKFTERCQLPITVKIITEQDKSGSDADMVGQMPSMLPTGWEECPKIKLEKSSVRNK